MESRINIKATATEMDHFFNGNSVCSVRYFEKIGDGRYKVTVRHDELESHLRGTFTIPRLIEKLSGSGEAVKWWGYLMYLRDWADSHIEPGYYGMTPVCFDEWLNCEGPKV